MSDNEIAEKLLIMIHQDLKQLLEKRFLNSLDTSLAILVPIAAALLAILRFYNIFTSPKILNLLMIGIILCLIIPIVLNVVSIITNKLTFRVFAWSSLSILITNWLFLILSDQVAEWVKSTLIMLSWQELALGMVIKFSFLMVFAMPLNVVVTLKLTHCIGAQIPSRRMEIERPYALVNLAFFHPVIVVFLVVLFDLVI